MVISFLVYGLWLMLLSVFYNSITHAKRKNPAQLAELVCLFKEIGDINLKGEQVETRRQEQ